MGGVSRAERTISGLFAVSGKAQVRLISERGQTRPEVSVKAPQGVGSKKLSQNMAAHGRAGRGQPRSQGLLPWAE
jgi:hypothetical protein